MAGNDIESARWKRDLWRCGLAGCGFGAAHWLSGGAYNPILVALVVFPVTLFAYRTARKLGIETADDIAFERPDVPENLPKNERRAMLYRIGMEQLEATQRDRLSLLKFVVPIFAVLFALAALLKFVNGQ